jgi:hypothetical protein
MWYPKEYLVEGLKEISQALPIDKPIRDFYNSIVEWNFMDTIGSLIFAYSYKIRTDV